MNPLLNSWQRLFTKHGFDVDLSTVIVPSRKNKENLPIVWPIEMTDDDIVSLFASSVEKTLGFGAFIPPSLASFQHVRNAANGSYVHWVTSPIYKDGEDLVSTRASMDGGITLPELYLYHSWMIEEYGKVYGLVVGQGNEFCHGTTYIKAPNKSPELEWDPHDIKVVLRHGYRIPGDYLVVNPK